MKWRVKHQQRDLWVRVMDKKERDKRRERLKIFANNNQWIKKGDMEQTLDEMSAQLREYRRDLQQIRMQEMAMEGKIDRLQRQVDEIESKLRGKPQESNTQTVQNKITNFYDKFDADRRGVCASYSENGLEREEHFSSLNMYA